MIERKSSAPSLDAWLREAKRESGAEDCGMYLFHNGVVRRSARAKVRLGDESAPDVRGLRLSCDEEALEQALAQARALPGIRYARAWVNSGELAVGDDMMLVLVGGDIRPRVIEALQRLVEAIKTRCVTETELS
ncbi:MAG: molybdenum cofactor biosynthesis protein MoaE [Oscillospiraceae bacterium]|nr:molybdenum cofactor biosynthesis protein MoaE [Oscillospiraceae bacterium]